MQIGSVVWEEFYHIHTHIHTYIHTHGIALSIRVTLNTKPASQVLIIIIIIINNQSFWRKATSHVVPLLTIE